MSTILDRSGDSIRPVGGPTGPVLESTGPVGEPTEPVGDRTGPVKDPPGSARDSSGPVGDPTSSVEGPMDLFWTLLVLEMLLHLKITSNSGEEQW